MSKEKKGERCYIAAFVACMVSLAFYVLEAAIMLRNSAEVGIFSELLILSVVIGAVSLALAVIGITAFGEKRKVKITLLILSAALIFVAAFCAVYGYGTKGGVEWSLKHNASGFGFDAAVGAIALGVAFVALIVVPVTSTAAVRAEKRVIRKQKRAEKKAELDSVRARQAVEAEEERRVKEEQKARLAEEKRLTAEKLAEEKRLAQEKRAEEKRLDEMKAAEEKEKREQEKAAKKAVAAAASTAVATSAPIAQTNKAKQSTKERRSVLVKGRVNSNFIRLFSPAFRLLSRLRLLL